MRGRKPKPTHLKLIQGNPGRRPINQAEPVAPPALPDPPDYLTPKALLEWNRLGPLLRDSGLLSNLDSTAFAAYCQSFAIWVEASEDLAKSGRYMRTPSGRLTISKCYELMHFADKRMIALAAEFGLTPSSRSRIKVAEQPLNDEFDEYMRNSPNAPVPRP